MANSSKIGALMVSLGLDSASFQAGLKTASVNLNKFGQIAATSFKVVAAGAAFAGAAMGVAVKHAIDYADAIDDAAQKTGVTAEALSRLGYVAKIEGVGLDGLSAGLIKLNKAMAEAATSKTSGAAVAFKALGVSVTDANGRLRSSDAVFTDLAGSFARMRDGATKSSLAMQIFGKSGADLIPMLNYGTDGLKRMADESDRFGQTISGKTAAAAGTFNDTLTKIGHILEGVTYQVMEAALPAMQSLASAVADPKFAEFASMAGTSIVSVLAAISEGAANAANNIRMIKDAFSGLDTMSAGGLDGRLRELGIKKLGAENKILEMQGRIARGDDLFGINRGAMQGEIEKQKAEIAAAINEEERILAILQTRNSSGAASGTVAATTASAVFSPVLAGAAKAKAAIEITIPPLNEMQQAIADVGSAFDNAASSAISGLISDVIKGQNAFDGLISKVGQLGDQLIDMALNSAIQGFFGSLLGGLFGGGGMGLGMGGIGRQTYGGVGGFFPGFPSFAGGGYTGMGARAGGIDGMGGFPALLHPNETVIDHTRGGGAGGSLQVTVISEVRNGNLVPTMARVAGEVAGQKVNSMAPLAVSKFQQDRKGG